MSSPTLCSVWEKMGNNRVESWKKQIQWYSENDYFSELNRIDGQLAEIEWKIFLGFTTVAILNQIRQMIGELQCEPENFTGRIIFMLMFYDFVWDAKGNDELRVSLRLGIPIERLGIPPGSRKGGSNAF